MTNQQIEDAALEAWPTTVGLRYVAEETTLSLWASLRKWVRGCRVARWDRTDVTFRPVIPGEEGYEEASYEVVIVRGRGPSIKIATTPPSEKAGKFSQKFPWG